MSELTQSKHYDYVPIIDREPFKLPDGARVAVMPYINIEHFPAAIPGTSLIPGTAEFSPDHLTSSFFYNISMPLISVFSIFTFATLLDQCCKNFNRFRSKKCINKRRTS